MMLCCLKASDFYRVTGHSQHTFVKIIQTSLGHGCQHLQTRRVGLLDKKKFCTCVYIYIKKFKTNGEKYFCIVVIAKLYVGL